MSKGTTVYFLKDTTTLVNLQKAPLLYSLISSHINSISKGTENARANSKDLGRRKHCRVFVPTDLLSVIKKTSNLRQNEKVVVCLSLNTILCEVVSQGDMIPVKDVDVILDVKQETDPE